MLRHGIKKKKILLRILKSNNMCQFLTKRISLSLQMFRKYIHFKNVVHNSVEKNLVQVKQICKVRSHFK